MEEGRIHSQRSQTKPLETNPQHLDEPCNGTAESLQRLLITKRVVSSTDGLHKMYRTEGASNIRNEGQEW